ncbi:NLR family CARD domain-containing protein 3-like isoform X3 [Myxocyprinus asiaticus]|uniref:NLR family CARD domain-containing protein 3-like isoform X3 n=1 Tax=Myxocyprinus asiaticus TaxID=70543 RepID=UPI002223726D|nr:NLR family CARD domain-containing protein 3-like isoform X3 [Myxocyprinus asiaticus]
MASSSSPVPTVQSAITAQSQSTVISPVLSGSTFNAPVYITTDSKYRVTAETEGSSEDPEPSGGTTTEKSRTDHVDYSEVSIKLKNTLKQEYEQILDGNLQTSHQKYLNDIYTDLYVVKNETGGVVNEHEVRQIESNLNRPAAEDIQIQCSDIFKVQRDTGRQNRKVLTMGIAGVGKTVSVNKFILDWAEGKENQDIVFIFPLPFRQLNFSENQCSLMELLHNYFNPVKQLQSLPEGDGEVMFIFDGLDECRFPLNFDNNERFTDIHEKTSVSQVVTNLINRSLLPSALVWITSRPAAASQIPREHINQVTEVRGFNDEQKEKYFNKNSSPDVSEKIISHIKKSRSLNIMCHIPVFCWISVIVLEPLLNQGSHDKIPTTLTGMYISFLLFQMHQMKRKFSEGVSKSFDQIVLKLGKLAFKQLEKGNLIFCKEDLEECGLDVCKVSVNSGLCTQIFQREKTFHERAVYSFVHLSVQEFLAALYVFFKYVCFKRNALLQTLQEKIKWKFSKKSLLKLHMTGVERALMSKNGHLDLFLRFLLGLSLESNQDDLKELLQRLEVQQERKKDIAVYIKNKIEEAESAEKTLNLFHCLSELKDDSLVEEIQKYLSSGDLSGQTLSSAQWSALVFVLLMSDETQEMFELRKYRRSDEALMRLQPVIKNTRRALLAGCNLTDGCCESLSSVLQSSNSLRELDLSNNDLQDSGVKLLSDALKSPRCTLEVIRLAGCRFTDECCESLSSVLQSSNSLRELDLSNNDLQDSGVKLLSDALKSPHCTLEILRLSGCMVTEKGCCSVASALSSNPSHLRELDLSYNHPGVSGVKLLSERLNDPKCTLDKLNVDHGGEFRITAGLHKYVCDLTLDSNTANTQLILSEGNRKVTHVRERQSYPDHPERFDWYHQVLCRESLTGRCYWETQWSETGAVISVSYKGISRKGGSHDCWFGLNVNSWSLFCSNERFSVCHNNNFTDIHSPSHNCKRVGVYVDCPAGTLSFYSVSDTHTLTHLHTFNTTFTQPLYAGFRVYPDSSVCLCEIEHQRHTHTTG